MIKAKAKSCEHLIGYVDHDGYGGGGYMIDIRSMDHALDGCADTRFAFCPLCAEPIDWEKAATDSAANKLRADREREQKESARAMRAAEAREKALYAYRMRGSEQEP